MKHRARHVAAHQQCVHTHTGRKRQCCPWDPASGRKRTCQDIANYVMLARSMWNGGNFMRVFGVSDIAVKLFCWYECLKLANDQPTMTGIKRATSHFWGFGQRIPVPRGLSLLMICSWISPQILVQMASVQPSPAYNLSYDSGEGRSTSQLQPQCSPHLSSAAPSAELGCPAGALNKKRWPHGQTLNPEKS